MGACSRGQELAFGTRFCEGQSFLVTADRQVDSQTDRQTDKFAFTKTETHFYFYKLRIVTSAVTRSMSASSSG